MARRKPKRVGLVAPREPIAGKKPSPSLARSYGATYLGGMNYWGQSARAERRALPSAQISVESIADANREDPPGEADRNFRVVANP